MKNTRQLMLFAMVCACFLCCYGGMREMLQYKDSINAANQRFDYLAIRKWSGLLWTEAEKENDTDMKAYAMLYQGAACLFSDEIDKAPDKFRRAIDLAQASDNDSVQALAFNYMAIYEASANDNLYLASRLFRMSRRKAEECGFSGLMISLDNNLARLSVELHDTTGTKYAMATLKYGLEENDLHYTYAGHVNMAQFEMLKGDSKSAREHLDKAWRANEGNRFRKEGILHLLYSRLADMEGNHKKAYNEVQMAIENLLKENPQLLSEAYLQLAALQNKDKEYSTSIKTLAKAIDAQNTYDNVSKNTDIYRLLSENHKVLGHDSKALEALEKSVETMPKKIDEYRQMIYNEHSMAEELIDKEHSLRQQKTESEARLRFIVVLCALLAAAILIALILHRNRRRTQRLYDSIVEANRQRLLSEKEAEAAKEKENNHTPSVAQPSSEPHRKQRYNISDDKASEIFETINRLMKEERLYADYNHTREQMIERVGTNSSYLAQIIMEKSGMNYAQYVNSFRIREAIERLSAPEGDQIILKELSAELGFGSPSTFYKLFQAETGISPANYRKSANRLNNNRQQQK